MQDPAAFEVIVLFLLTFILLNNIKFQLVNEDKFIFFLLYVFALLSIFTVLVAEDKFASFIWNAITILLIVAMILIRVVLEEVEYIKKILIGYIYGGVLTSFISLVSYLIETPFSNKVIKFDIRLSGFFQDPNVFSPFLIPIIILLLEDIKSNFLFKKKFLLKLTSILIVLIAITLAMSRAAWVNLFISFILYMLMKVYKNKKLLLKLIPVTFFLSVIIIYIFNINSNLQVFDQLMNRIQLQNYDSERLNSQTHALSVTGEHLFTGIGPGQFISTYNLSPHNTLLRLAAETGIFTLIIYLCLFFYLVIKLIKISILNYKFNLPLVILVVLIGTFVNSLVVDILHWRHYWFLLGLGWVCIVHYRKLILKKEREKFRL
ncbi:hypothetical protein ABE41_018280 [Fictibacillus arsenicus]|uniref:O-antigen ligase-related domain-containing protein n=1 Tax=Fictibacillus arsenicus TaxID=255247 RepID=A0A1B1Z955_9BACL|nr:O-antigen ligase family protein [Fictibacillus arsenicus]ANX13964.1 hypothetical protein ABE41_018280 [Fictibacillus arsenicus]